MPSLDDEIALWTQRLRTIAQTGLAFKPPVYDAERYEELLQLAADMAARRSTLTRDEQLSQKLYEKWRAEIQSGVAGYVTPKVGVGAIVFNERDELLLIERPSHVWLFPTGWSDIGYTPAQVAAKEVREETGLEVIPERLIAVYDLRRLIEQDLDQHLYSILFYCRLVGGEIKTRPHEALNVGFFARDALPTPLGREEVGWVDLAWKAQRGELAETYFDPI